MKTITMNYEEYQKDIREAKEAGFELTVGLKEKLKDVLSAYNSMDSNRLGSATQALYKVIDQLERCE